MLISIIKEDKYMKLIMSISLSLSLVGCLSSQGQSPDSKVSNQEVHKEVESQATHATSLREREDSPVKTVLNINVPFSFASLDYSNLNLAIYRHK
jgi:hypothetical protein